MYEQRLLEIQAGLSKNQLDGQWTGQLLRLRQDVAEAFLVAPLDALESLYLGDLGNAQRALLKMGVAGYPILPQEQVLASGIVRELAQQPGNPQMVARIIAGMLYSGPHRLLQCEHLLIILPWLMDGFMKYSVGLTAMFKERGEVEAYCEHLSRWVNYLHENILVNRAAPFWQSVLWAYINNALFISLYFSWQNLRNLSRQRAELIECALELSGAQLAYTFPARSTAAVKIRYGVLAPHFMPRAETFATLPMYAHIDRDKFEVILITLAQRERDALEQYCVASANKVIELPNDIAESVAAIRALDLDMLWIGTNVTAGYNHYVRLAAHRLARLQLTGGCSPVSSGLRNIDVFISGDLTEPDAAQDHYTEKLICMDGPLLSFDFGPHEKNPAARNTSRASLRVAEDAVVYASGANFFKITPELEELWIRILAATPDSRLLLYPFNPNWTKSYPSGPFFHRIVATCVRLGVNPNRLLVVPPLPGIADIRQMLGSVADVYLDSFPHSGMTSLMDPLYAGVPTVVHEGNSQRSRMASGALRDLGIEELIASDDETYLQLAVRLGADADLRRDISQRIREQLTRPPKFLDAKWCGNETSRILKSLASSHL